MQRVLAAALVALALNGCASVRDPLAGPPGVSCAGEVAITHVTVLPMTGVSELRDQTVITSEGRIVRVGSSDDVRPPRNACVIVGRGHFLMPGFADAHVHVFDEGDMALYLRFGVTSVLNMSGSHMHLRLREALEAGRVDGPTLYTTGPMLKIDASPLIEFEETPASAAGVAPMIASYHEAGYDFVKVWGAFQPDLYEAIRQAANAQHMRMTGHIPRDVGLERVLAAGQSIAHVEEFLNKYFREDPSAAQREALAVRLTSAGATVTTTLVTYEAIAASNAADATPLLSRPGAEFMDPVRLAMWAPGANRLRRSERDPAELVRAVSTMQAITLSLQNGGARLLVGTDAGELPGLVPGLDLHRELELMVQAGMSTEDVLRAATSNFGDYMADQGDRFGVIEVGSRADLLLLDADPRANIDNTRAIRGVMARGAYYDRAALDALVSSLQRRNARTAGYVAAFSNSSGDGADYIAAQWAAGETPTALTPALFMALGVAARGDLAGAETLLRQVADIYPDREEPWFIIAGIHRVSGDASGAIAALDEVLSRAPDHERARRDRAALIEQQQSQSR